MCQTGGMLLQGGKSHKTELSCCEDEKRIIALDTTWQDDSLHVATPEASGSEEQPQDKHDVSSLLLLAAERG